MEEHRHCSKCGDMIIKLDLNIYHPNYIQDKSYRLLICEKCALELGFYIVNNEKYRKKF